MRSFYIKIDYTISSSDLPFTLPEPEAEDILKIGIIHLLSKEAPPAPQGAKIFSNITQEKRTVGGPREERREKSNKGG